MINGFKLLCATHTILFSKFKFTFKLIYPRNESLWTHNIWNKLIYNVFLHVTSRWALKISTPHFMSVCPWVAEFYLFCVELKLQANSHTASTSQSYIYHQHFGTRSSSGFLNFRSTRPSPTHLAHEMCNVFFLFCGLWNVRKENVHSWGLQIG